MGRKANIQPELFDLLAVQKPPVSRQVAGKLGWRDHFAPWGVCPLCRHNNFDLCKPPQVKYRSLNCLGCGVKLDIKYHPPASTGVSIAYFGRKELAYLREFPNCPISRKYNNGK